MNKKNKTRGGLSKLIAYGMSAAVMVMSSPLWASTAGGSLQFASKAQEFESNFNAWLFIASVIVVSATAFLLAFAEFGEGVKKLVGAGFWISIAGMSYSVIALFWGTGAVF